MKRYSALSIILLLALSCSKDDATTPTTDPTPTPSPTPTPISIQTPEIVDLGLSVKWASFNIGATKPEEYGRYFAWADVNGQTWKDSTWSGNGFSYFFSYIVNNTTANLNPEYDAAHVLLGGNWRMPTKAEQEELFSNCTHQWVSNYNGTKISGRVFTSKKAGFTDKSIFLPATGSGGKSGIYYVGSFAYYWSSTVGTLNNSWYLTFGSADIKMEMNYRSNGQPIRPVTTGE